MWKKLVIWPSAAIVFLVVLFYLINAFDQQLDPEIAALIKVSKNPLLPEKNAYFSLLAFDASSGQDIHVVGVKYADVVDQAYREDPNKAPPDEKIFLGASPLRFVGDASLLCEHKKTDCLEKYRNNATQIEKLLSANQELIGRYRSLYKYPHSRETITPTVQSPIPAYPSDAHKLVLGQAALYLRKNRVDLALSSLKEDTDFWRMVLSADESLISQMLAAFFLERDVLFLSDIVRLYDLKESHLNSTREILRPLGSPEFNMSSSMRREFMIMVQTYQHIESSYKDEPHPMFGETKTHDIFLHPLFNANATINMAYDQFKDMVTIAALPAHEFIDHVPYTDASRLSQNPLHYIYNPIGKILLSIAQPDYTRYIARIHNLDGLIRAVALQMEIKLKQIKGDDIPTFVEAAGLDYYDPYTRKPMQWDSEKRTLFFEGVGRKRGTTRTIRVNL